MLLWFGQQWNVLYGARNSHWWTIWRSVLGCMGQKLEQGQLWLTQVTVWVLQGTGDMDDWMPPPPEEDPSQMDLLPPADSNMPDEAASVGSAGG